MKRASCDVGSMCQLINEPKGQQVLSFILFLLVGAALQVCQVCPGLWNPNAGCDMFNQGLPHCGQHVPAHR